MLTLLRWRTCRRRVRVEFECLGQTDFAGELANWTTFRTDYLGSTLRPDARRTDWSGRLPARTCPPGLTWPGRGTGSLRLDSKVSRSTLDPLLLLLVVREEADLGGEWVVTGHWGGLAEDWLETRPGVCNMPPVSPSRKTAGQSMTDEARLEGDAQRPAVARPSAEPRKTSLPLGNRLRFRRFLFDPVLTHFLDRRTAIFHLFFAIQIFHSDKDTEISRSRLLPAVVRRKP